MSDDYFYEEALFDFISWLRSCQQTEIKESIILFIENAEPKFSSSKTFAFAIGRFLNQKMKESNNKAKKFELLDIGFKLNFIVLEHQYAHKKLRIKNAVQ